MSKHDFTREEFTDRLTRLRASIAEQILKIAKTGERDPVRLRERAIQFLSQ